MSKPWYEIWADEGHDIPYVLMLRPVGARFEVLDPRRDNARVFESDTYQSAKLYLLEDEFVCVGRKELDDI